MRKTRGVYFLSNNTVHDLTVAFLNSFRAYNPSIPLCFIPYNDECSKISSLKDEYQFRLFEDIELLRQCDDIGKRFHGEFVGAYRKLAMWNGPFDEFAYIDVDTVVLDNIDFVFRFLNTYPCLTSHSNIDSLRKFVWKDSIYHCNQLSAAQIAFSANTGFIVSKRGFMDMEQVSIKTDRALALRDHMALICKEQPFLNYMIVTSGKSFTSLYYLYYHLNTRKNIMLEKWAGVREGRVSNGRIRGLRRPVFLVHWAGLWGPGKFDFMLHRLLQALRIVSENSAPRVRFRTPYKRLWLYYRNLREN